MSAVLRVRREGELADQEQPKWDGIEKRAQPSAWADPRTWVSITALLLTICMTIGGFIASKLTSIDSAMQHLLVSQTETATRQSEQIATLQRDLAEQRAKLEKTIADQTAYNYDLMKQLTQIKSDLRAGGKDVR